MMEVNPIYLIVIGILLVAIIGYFHFDNQNRIQRCIDEGGWQENCDRVHELQPDFDCDTPLNRLTRTGSDATWKRMVCMNKVAQGWNG